MVASRRLKPGAYFIYHRGKWWAGEIEEHRGEQYWVTANAIGTRLRAIPVGELATIRGPIPTPDDPQWKALVGK